MPSMQLPLSPSGMESVGVPVLSHPVNNSGHRCIPPMQSVDSVNGDFTNEWPLV